MTIIIGLIVMLGCMLGGFAAMGGHIMVLWQPWEFVIILGTSLGTFIVANPMKVIKDTGKAFGEAFGNAAPSTRHYLDIMGLSTLLMRELRSKPRNEVEKHIDQPQESEIFQKFSTVVSNPELTTFVCDYCRLIIIGNARTHEVESPHGRGNPDAAATTSSRPITPLPTSPMACLRSASSRPCLAS